MKKYCRIDLVKTETPFVVGNIF